LHHPNIVEVHDFGAVDGEYFLAMEYVDGVNLTALLKTAAAEQRQIPPGLVSLVISNVAAALAYAHALTDDQGRPLDIIHRDVSPANIMLSWLGEVKLVDFGIAEVANQVGDEGASGDTLKGKLGYMSPEQAAAERIDRRSDIFSLGIVFYEALVLARLFKGASDPETLRLVREAQVTPPSLLFKDLDPAIEAVVMKMLAPRPADRYASGGEVVAALAPIIRRRGADALALRQFLQAIHPPRPAVPLAEDEPVTVSVH
jgi:serine/threonine protein kinase